MVVHDKDPRKLARGRIGSMLVCPAEEDEGSEFRMLDVYANSSFRCRNPEVEGRGTSHFSAVATDADIWLEICLHPADVLCLACQLVNAALPHGEPVRMACRRPDEPLKRIEHFLWCQAATSLLDWVGLQFSWAAWAPVCSVNRSPSFGSTGWLWAQVTS